MTSAVTDVTTNDVATTNNVATTNKAVTNKTLLQENEVYQKSTGVSQNNSAFGFIPAFHDVESGQLYVSCFADGRPAPIHLLDGLPDSLITERLENGTVKSVKGTVVSGFLHMGNFYTRDQAAALL